MATSSPIVHLTALIQAVIGLVARGGGSGVVSGALAVLAFRRLSAIGLRLERLAARFAVGRVWRRGPRDGDGGRMGAKGSCVRRVRIWPPGFGWLVRAMAHQAAGYGGQLREILGTPEMVALLTAAPQAGRLLRPLCRMLAVETSLLRPRPVAAPAVEDDIAVVAKRVRAPRAPIDWGRIPLPEGVLAAARRRGFKPGL